MKKTSLVFLLVAFLSLLAGGCDLVQAFAPPPTSVPTPTTAAHTETPLPTLGAAEYLDAAYCTKSHIDDNEFSLIRFYPSGVVLDLMVQGYASCEEAWEKTAPYLGEDAINRFSHGEYQFSGSQIRFTLSPANSNQVVGTVTGRYHGEKMFLARQGADEWEYTLVFGGKLP
ncbi:MAG: hypothetical protein ACOY0R_06875 [Chloroflexota bacterium]